MSYTHSKSAPKRRGKRTSISRGKGSRKSSETGRRDGDEPIAYERSSGNVFLDIGFSPAEAANLLVRSELMVRIRKKIDRHRLTQAKAAKLFGVTQPRISDLVRGKINVFNVESLIGMLTHAGMQVTVSVKPAA